MGRGMEGSPYDHPSYTIKIEVVPATGQRLIVAEVP